MALLDVFKKKEESKKKAVAPKPKAALTLKPKAEVMPATVTAPAQTKRSAANARVLVRPLVTEKGTALAAQNKYAFEVISSATKNEVKKAIAAVYNVTPVSVAVMVIPSKARAFGRRAGRTSRWKKAIVTLKQGQSITVFEGV